MARKKRLKRMTTAEFGARGGKAGTGEAKKRGDSEYYRELAKAMWLKRKQGEEKA